MQFVNRVGDENFLTNTMARILVIEDADDEREFLRELLMSAGHQVCVARNGKIALSLLREWHVEAVVTDMLMPEMDGVETIMALRQQYPDVKIIAVSGVGSVSPGYCLRLARNLGAQIVIPKPFAPGEILDAIHNLSDLRPAS
jgi:CheY-like chemotaxis protein